MDGASVGICTVPVSVGMLLPSLLVYCQKPAGIIPARDKESALVYWGTWLAAG